MNLTDKLRKLADEINKSIVYKQLAWDERGVGQWSKLWASYYALRDAQEAITEWTKIASPKRLEMYGLLQALVVQQDAFRHIQEAMGIRPIEINEETHSELHEIRLARHQLAGHPSQTMKSRNSSYEEGTRTHTTIGYGGDSKTIEYVVASGKGSKTHRLSLSEVVETQESVLSSEVDNLINLIAKEDESHKGKFEIGSLQKILHTSTYLAGKAYSFERDHLYAKISIDSLLEIYEKFKKEICSRYNVETIDDTIHAPGLVGELEKIDQTLPRVVKMLEDRQETDDLDLDVYAESLTNSFRLLQEMAKEIDEEFDVKKIES